MNRVFLDLGFFQIYWYSLFIFLGVLLAMTVIYKEIKQQKISVDFFLNMAFYTVIFGIIGARLYYCLFNFSYYSHHFLEVFQIWEGGLAIHGGILFGGLTILYHTKKYKQSTLKILIIMGFGRIFRSFISSKKQVFAHWTINW